MRPEVPTVEFLAGARNRANYDFADACLEGVRGIITTHLLEQSGAKSLDFREYLGAMWKFPDTFPIGSYTGFWQSIIIIVPGPGREMESQMVSSASGKTKPGLNLDSKKNPCDGGWESSYPTGKRLRAYEQDDARQTPCQ